MFIIKNTLTLVPKLTIYKSILRAFNGNRGSGGLGDNIANQHLMGSLPCFFSCLAPMSMMSKSLWHHAQVKKAIRRV